MTQLQKALARLRELEQLQAVRCRSPRDPSKIGYYIWRRRVAAGLKTRDVDLTCTQVEVSPNGVTLRTLKRFADKLGCKAWEIVKDWEDANP